MFLLDCHTHSVYSPDSQEPIETMIQTADRCGFSVLTVTDHCECDRFDADHYPERLKASMEEIHRLQPDAPLKLLCGVEIGQAMQNRQAADRVADQPYDFILGSLHRARGRNDYYLMDYSAYTEQEYRRLLEEYLEELIEMAHWNRLDSLAHLTYPMRYLDGEFHLPVNFHWTDDHVRELFRILIENGKALEVNTSGLRQAIGQTLPDLFYLKLFRELGGKYVTIGSDAHQAADLGRGIREGLSLIREAGFEEVTYFIRHQPVRVHF